MGGPGSLYVVVGLPVMARKGPFFRCWQATVLDGPGEAASGALVASVPLASVAGGTAASLPGPGPGLEGAGAQANAGRPASKARIRVSEHPRILTATQIGGPPDFRSEIA